MGCIDGFFPQVDLWDDVTFDDEDIQEELRCFYVAITRAEERLYLVCPKQVKTYYGVVPAKITRFLDGCEHAYQESDSYIRLS